MDATEIHLDGNDMTELIGPGFIGRRHAIEVFLNNSNILTIGPLSLEGLTGMKVLHLEDNKLEELFNRQFSGLPALRQLHLKRNQLTGSPRTRLMDSKDWKFYTSRETSWQVLASNLQDLSCHLSLVLPRHRHQGTPPPTGCRPQPTRPLTPSA